MRLTELVAFAKERDAIRQRRAAGMPAPWTQSPILQEYRFCNVRRNDDRQTKLLHDNWLHPYKGHPDLWFAMCVARLVNWWPSVDACYTPGAKWRPQWFIDALQERARAGEKVFTAAYMIRADKVPDGGKETYLAHQVLTPLWEQRAAVRPRKGDTLDAFHQRLMGFRDFGSFMAAQVVADVKYDSLGALSGAPDWWTWAASGPGSQRGLNRVLGYATDSKWHEDVWRARFSDLLPQFNKRWARPNSRDIADSALTGQDLQNVLCEFDKYERVRLGEGRPRSKFVPSTN